MYAHPLGPTTTLGAPFVVGTSARGVGLPSSNNLVTRSLIWLIWAPKMAVQSGLHTANP